MGYFMGYFMGVSSISKLKPVSSYDDAVRAHAAGDLNSKVVSIRRNHEDAIVFRLYATDVVTWYPNENIQINNYASQTTGEFISKLTPFSGSGAAELITYFHNPLAPVVETEDWRSRWEGARIVHGDVFFNKEGESWVPDLDTCGTFTTLILDQVGARAVSKEHHMADFKLWLEMATPLLDLQYEGEDLDAVSEALKVKDFRKAAVHLPAIEIGNGFGIKDRIKPLKIATHDWQRVVTMTSLQRVRDYIYDQADLLTVDKRKILQCGELSRLVRRNAAFDKANLTLPHCLGWGYR